jgi:hypothetical protein
VFGELLAIVCGDGMGALGDGVEEINQGRTQCVPQRPLGGD